MLTVWKTALDMRAAQEIDVPVGAEFLCAREQFEQVCVWYRCDPSAAAREKRTLAIVGTGHAAPADGRYIGTASLHGGNLIFHVFVKERT